MAAPVAGKESDALAVECAGDITIRGRAKGGIHCNFLDLGQRFHLVDAAAADDSEANRFRHAMLTFCDETLRCDLILLIQPLSLGKKAGGNVGKPLILGIARG